MRQRRRRRRGRRRRRRRRGLGGRRRGREGGGDGGSGSGSAGGGEGGGGGGGSSIGVGGDGAGGDDGGCQGSSNLHTDSASSPSQSRGIGQHRLGLGHLADCQTVGRGVGGGGLKCPLHPLAPTLHGARVLGPWECPFPTGPGDYAQPHVPSPRRGASPTHPHQPPASPLLPLPLPPPPAQPSSKSCHLRCRLNLTCQRHNQAAAQQRAIVRAASRVQTGGGWRGAAGTPVSGCMTASRIASGRTRRGKRPSRSHAT